MKRDHSTASCKKASADSVPTSKSLIRGQDRLAYCCSIDDTSDESIRVNLDSQTSQPESGLEEVLLQVARGPRVHRVPFAQEQRWPYASFGAEGLASSGVCEDMAIERGIVNTV